MQSAKTRTCFDVTLKGYAAFHSGERPENEFEGVFEGLVKWIVAPSRTALDCFIRTNGLEDLLDADPYAMSDHASNHYGLDDGVDFIVNSEGKVLEGDPSCLAEWRSEVILAAGLLNEVSS